jgi:hypothetical protein
MNILSISKGEWKQGLDGAAKSDKKRQPLTADRLGNRPAVSGNVTRVFLRST